MPRRHLTLTPVRDLSVESINALVRQLQEHLAYVTDALTELQGGDGKRPVMSNDLDMGGHDIVNVGSVDSVIDSTSTSAVELPPSFTVTDPVDAPATADALRDDLVANTLPDIVEALNLIAAAVRGRA